MECAVCHKILDHNHDKGTHINGHYTLNGKCYCIDCWKNCDKKIIDSTDTKKRA